MWIVNLIDRDIDRIQTYTSLRRMQEIIYIVFVKRNQETRYKYG